MVHSKNKQIDDLNKTWDDPKYGDPLEKQAAQVSRLFFSETIKNATFLTMTQPHMIRNPIISLLILYNEHVKSIE